jgi:hypothetical protein
MDDNGVVKQPVEQSGGDDGMSEKVFDFVNISSCGRHRKRRRSRKLPSRSALASEVINSARVHK